MTSVFFSREHVSIGKMLLGTLTGFFLSSTAFAAENTELNLAFSNSDMNAMMPLAITGGVGLFAVLACAMWLRAYAKSAKIKHQAAHEVSAMRATLDHAEALLSGMERLIITWQPEVLQPEAQRQNTGPRITIQPLNLADAQIFGGLKALENVGLSRIELLEFRNWLAPGSVAVLQKSLDRLRAQGTNFTAQLTTLVGHIVSIEGRLSAGSPMLCFADVLSEYEQQQKAERAADAEMSEEPDFWALANALALPVWALAPNGQLLNANRAYLDAVAIDTLDTAIETNAQFLPSELLQKSLSMPDQNARQQAVLSRHENGADRQYTISAHSNQRETICIATAHLAAAAALPQPSQSDLDIDQMRSAAIGHLSTPTAMFDHDRQITHYNQAFIDLWELNEHWLDDKPDEMAILDRLRTEGKLPNEVDYRAWRDAHLRSYHADSTVETLWYLPDGRTLKVVAIPAPDRGVTYTYENVTDQLELESRYKTLTRVQGETLAHLSEGVVVFGTNGRLDLHNAVFARQWHLPTNLLNSVPHIDQIIAECAREFGDEAIGIWNKLRAQVISLGENRQTQNGRISRADDTLFDYLIVPLPNGKTMMNFVDVTASANLENLLKERNDALEMADRLKDDFIQHVSYELRTPLTNIIGFSDMLSDGDIGPLNDKQREYAEFIRSSSSSLKILVDHILDLADIDAGVAELNLSDVDIRQVISEAREGVEAKFIDNLSDHKLNLSVTVAPGLNSFTADRARIVQILYNLLSNAADYSEPGDKIALSFSSDDDAILFAIEDEGEGIPDDIAASVFDLFQGSGKNGSKRSAGLGLSIVQAFVELHGGKARIAKTENGTRVEISIPKSLSALKDAAIAASATG